MITAVALFAALPLGTLTPNGAADRVCPPGYVCTGFDVVCSGVTERFSGFTAIAQATSTPRGVIVFFTGGSGTGYWSSQSRDLPPFADELRSLGFTIVQVRWQQNWLESSPGNDAGPAHLGCAPATAIKHVYDTIFIPLGVQRTAIGRCGFCITGNSGGSTQVAYALTHYGLEPILDGVFPTGGPPHSALAKSCLGERGYEFDSGTRAFIDRGFGFFDGNGPCVRRDSSFTPRWNEESVATGGTDYYHATTRVHVIWGSNDRGMQTIGGDYVERLREAGTPFLTVTIAANTPHGVYSTPEGRSAIRDAILSSGVVSSRRRAVRP